MTLPTKHSKLFVDKGAPAQIWLLSVGMGQCGRWEIWQLLGSHSVRSVAGGIQFTVILETSGTCSLREMRNQVAKIKKIYCYYWPYECDYPWEELLTTRSALVVQMMLGCMTEIQEQIFPFKTKF